MNKKELLEKLSERCDLSQKDINLVLTNLAELTKETLEKGDSIMILNICKLEMTHRKERSGRNPHTGEGITIPARDAAKCSLVKRIKDIGK